MVLCGARCKTSNAWCKKNRPQFLPRPGREGRKQAIEWKAVRAASEEAATLSPRASPPPKLSGDPRGRSGYSSAVARPPVRTRRSRRPRSSSSSDPLRRSCREPRVRHRDPRLLPVTRYLSPPHRAPVLQLLLVVTVRASPLFPLRPSGM